MKETEARKIEADYNLDRMKAGGNFTTTISRENQYIYAKGYLEGLLTGRVEVSEKAKVLEDALKSIDDSRNAVLLGRCCVDETCCPSESGCHCELQEKTNTAFTQSADTAKEALAEWEAEK